MAINSKFFKKQKDFFTLAEILELTNSKLEINKEQHLNNKIFEIATLDQAIKGEISFIHSYSYLPLLQNSNASYCFINPKFLSKKPSNIIALICDANGD